MWELSISALPQASNLTSVVVPPACAAFPIRILLLCIRSIFEVCGMMQRIQVSCTNLIMSNAIHTGKVQYLNCRQHTKRFWLGLAYGHHNLSQQGCLSMNRWERVYKQSMVALISHTSLCSTKGIMPFLVLKESWSASNSLSPNGWFYTSVDKIDPIRCLSWVVIAELKQTTVFHTGGSHPPTGFITCRCIWLCLDCQCSKWFHGKWKSSVDLTHSPSLHCGAAVRKARRPSLEHRGNRIHFLPI